MATRKTAAARKSAARRVSAKRKLSAKRRAPGRRKVAPRRRAAARKATAPAKSIKDRYSKTELLNHISDSVGLSRKQVQGVLEELSNVIEGHICKRGCGQFVLPGLMKVVTVKKPARKARKGINPFTGEPTIFKAKPASIQVRIRPLKKMKEMAA